MKRWMPVLCIAFVTTSFLGASAWEGSAMMSAFGEFPESGYYAACNSFPRNTAVEVVNLENGKTVTVIVTKGLENPGIFLLLSPEAAKALSLEPGALSRVRVSAPRNIAQTVPAGPGAAGDPDFNPSLLAARSGVSTTTAEPAAEPPVEPQVATSAPAAESAPETPIQASEAPASVPSAVAQGTGSQEGPSPEPGAGIAPSGINPPVGTLEQPDEPPQGPAVVVETPKTPILEAPVVQPELLSRPVLEVIEPASVAVFLPTPESAKPLDVPEERAVVHGLNRPALTSIPIETALADPVLVPDELPDTALTREAWPAETAPKVALADLEIRMDETGKPEALDRELGEAPAPERSPKVALEEPVPAAAAKRPSPASTVEPSAPEESQVIVSLEPTPPRPPQSAAEAVPGPAVSTAPAIPATSAAPAASAEKPTAGRTESVSPAEGLVPGMYYIQIGAYRSSPSLDAAVSRLRDTFPVTVDTVQAGSGPVYRLFVGPLGRDETGVALLRVRSLGFKEAFLKN